MRNKEYEAELRRHQQVMLELLDGYRESGVSWEFKDMLAIQRALQVLIESYIGLCRYLVEQRYGVKLSKSRAAIDELSRRSQLSGPDSQQLMRMIGFRNILVHDYLEINSDIVHSIVRKADYKAAQAIIEKLWGLLEEAG